MCKFRLNPRITGLVGKVGSMNKTSKMCNDSRIESIKEYLKVKYDIPPEKISRETSLLYDLEIRGDDVDEFLSFLVEDFKIEVKRLNLSRFYVGDESFDFISPTIRFFKGERVDQKPTLTINDIEKFIQNGILE